VKRFADTEEPIVVVPIVAPMVEVQVAVVVVPIVQVRRVVVEL
jgi:hypothetical protein